MRGHRWLLALPLLLAGCGGSGSGESTSRVPRALANQPAPCPRVALLAEGADLTRYRAGGGRDLATMTLDARIAGFDARCDYANSARTALDVRVTPRFTAERGPASSDRAAELPWFIAVTDAEDSQLLERVAASTAVTFPPNVQRAAATGRPVVLTLPLPEGARAADFNVRLSFQLTPEELELNRLRGPR
jgi:hypothetical protein